MCTKGNRSGSNWQQKHLVCGVLTARVADVLQEACQAKAMFAVQMTDENIGDGLARNTTAKGLPAGTLPGVHYVCVLFGTQSYARNIPRLCGTTCEHKNWSTA